MKTLMQQAAAYKMAIFIGVLFSVNALADVIVASFLNVEWGTLSGTSKFLIVVVVIKSWSGTMLAFFNKTLARIEAGKPAIDTGNTDFITKPATQTPTTT